MVAVVVVGDGGGDGAGGGGGWVVRGLYQKFTRRLVLKPGVALCSM